MSANLKTVACILSPLFWSRLYAAVSVPSRAPVHHSHIVCVVLQLFFATRSELCLSCCVAQGVRRGKAGLWFYTGVTVVTLVRLLVMRTLANEFGHAPTPRVASAKA